jgi:Xaa-Pro aminopeptidase
MSYPHESIGLDLAQAKHPRRYRSDEAVQTNRVSSIDRSLVDAYEALNRKDIRAFRLERLREQLRKKDYAGMLLADPMNIRYATDSHDMSIWIMHSPSRYVFVATEGPVVLFDFNITKPNNEHIETIDEIRTTTPWIYFLAGPRVDEKAELWAKEIADVVRTHGGGNTRLAVDRCDPWGAERLKSHGIQLFDAQPLTETARSIKCPGEIEQHRISMGVCDLGVSRMREALVPGITENQLWGIFSETNIAHDGEWQECHLLCSGPRTNPWFKESSNRVIEAGDIVGFDTDMVGPGGALSDISRSFICPGKPITGNQRDLLGFAFDQIAHNVSLLKPGITFREFGESCWPVPERYLHNRYLMMVHGVGLVDEAPSIAYAVDFDSWGYDGVVEENMILSVESYIGEVGGKEGVKLEEQVLITANGAIPFSSCPLVAELGG